MLFLTTCNISIYYDLKDAHLPALPRDPITKCLLSLRSFSGSLIVRLHRQSRLRHTSIRGETDRPEAFYWDPDVDSSSSYVVVRERRLPAATHVDSRLFRGFSSQHFRLGLFVRFKGNLAQPKAIRFEGGFEFHPPPRVRSARFTSNPIRNPFSTRRIEGAAQRRPDLHRLLGKVDPGFSFFESERHPAAIINCIG